MRLPSYLTDWYLFKRMLRHLYQRCTRGWDDSDTWGLDHVIAKFALPRLIKFKELNNGHPGEFTWEEWNDVLDDMIYAMEVNADEDRCYGFNDDEDWDRVNKGHEYFGKYFRDLWW